MIVAHKRPDGRLQMPFAKRNDARQALGSDGSDESLRKRVEIWAAGRQARNGHATIP